MTINVSKKEEVIIFRLSGKIISPGIEEISKTMEETLAAHASPPRLLFDFKEVTGIDSSGLGTLMKIYADIHPRDGKIAIINTNKRIKNLIIMARLITIFKSFENEDDAIAALLEYP